MTYTGNCSLKVFDAGSALFAMFHGFILVRDRLRKASAKLNIICR